MKKLLCNVWLLPALAIVLFTACKKDSGSSTTTTNTTGNYFMAAKVASDSFNATGTIQISAAFTSADTTLSIDGATGSGSTSNLLTLSLKPYKNTTGIFVINPGVISGFVSMAGSPKYAKYGQIVLSTATATEVAGTFSFTCSDSTKVTGAFDASVHTL